MAARIDVSQCIVGNDQSSVSSLWRLPAAINLVAQHSSSFGLVWLNVRWTKGNESWEEGKERRATILYFILFSSYMAISSFSPLLSVSSVVCTVQKGDQYVYFQDLGVTVCLSEQRRERYWKDVVQGLDLPFFFFFTFLCQFSEQTCHCLAAVGKEKEYNSFPPSCRSSSFSSWFLPHWHFSVFRCVLHFSIPVLLKRESTEPHDGAFCRKVDTGVQSHGGGSCQQSRDAWVKPAWCNSGGPAQALRKLPDLIQHPWFLLWNWRSY